MPIIIIRDYSWRQTSNFVIINVPLRGHPKKVDFFVIDDYLKVSFPPFILELYLSSNVVEEESKCIVKDNEAILTLLKSNINVEWPTLEVQEISKDLKREWRNRAFDRAQKLAEDRTKLKSERRQQLQKDAVKEQIKINTAVLNEIDATRDAHRKEAMQEFEDWRSKTELPFLSNAAGEVQENRKAYKAPLKWFKDGDDTLKSRSVTDEEILNDGTSTKEIERKGDDKKKFVEEQPESEDNECDCRTETPRKKNDSFTDSDTSCSEDSESDYEIQSYSLERMRRMRTESNAATKGSISKGNNNIFEEPSKKTSVPLPRKMGTINVTFSERKFPTPARESSHVEEQEWLQKQVEARRKIGFDSKDLRPEERDPQWLQDKGDDFYKVGNYLGAISAYSYGIKISDKMASLYENRSAAHYALENYQRCIEDCSKSAVVKGLRKLSSNSIEKRHKFFFHLDNRFLWKNRFAIELMEPRCEGNRESRSRCYARRGAALCKLSAPQHGIPELEAALELTPDNESIKRDLLAAKQYFDIKD